MGAAPEDGGLSPREGKGAALVAGAAPVGSPVKGLTYFFGYGGTVPERGKGGSPRCGGCSRRVPGEGLDLFFWLCILGG